MFRNFGFERFVRTLHGWMGALILPWIVLAGVTGLYLNHRDLVLSVMPMRAQITGAGFAADPAARRIDAVAAQRVAAAIVPDGPWRLDRDGSYRDRAVFRFDTGAGAVFVDRETGGAWHRQRYMITAYAPDGELAGRTLRWGRIMRSLHERGFVGNALGRWLADITALALVVFGISGLMLFAAPRLRRRRNRRARRAAVRAAAGEAAATAHASDGAGRPLPVAGGPVPG